MTQANQAYYSTVATVIPVMLLAVTLQGEVVVIAIAGYLRRAGQDSGRAEKIERYRTHGRVFQQRSPRFFASVAVLAKLSAWGLFFTVAGSLVSVAVWGEVLAVNALRVDQSTTSNSTTCLLGVIAMLSLVVLGLIVKVGQRIADARQRHAGTTRPPAA